MDNGPIRVLRPPLISVGVLLTGMFMAAPRMPFRFVSQLVHPLAGGLVPEEYSAGYERLVAGSPVFGLPCLVTAAWLLLDRRGLPARASRAAEMFTASYRTFRADLGGLIKSTAADRRALTWLLLITLAGVAIRVWFLNQPMRYDEAWTFLRFVAPGAGRLFDYPAPNNHVAHTLLVYLSTSALGAEPWAIRLPAFLAGIVLVPMAYLCARTVFHRSSGLVAAGLVAGSPFLVFYSTNARGYTILTVLSLALVPLTLYFVQKESSFAGCLVGLISAIGLYTIPIMLFPIAMLVAWSLALAYQAGGWTKTLRVARLGAAVLLLCAAIALALYAPVLVTSGTRRLIANQYVVPLDLGAAVAAWPRLAWETWRLYFVDMPGLLQAGLGACMLVGALYLWKANRPTFLLIPAALAGTGVVLLAMRTVPYARTWIFLLPLSFCLADAGVTGILTVGASRFRIHAAGALGILAAVGMSYSLMASGEVPYSSTDTVPDAEAIVRFLEPHLKEGDWVQVRRYWPLRYYAYRLGMPVELFGKSGRKGDGDTYVVVTLPNGTFGEATKTYGAPLDEEDFVVREFPSALLYLPKRPGD